MIGKILAVLLLLVGIYSVACTTYVTQTYCNEVLGVVQHYVFSIIIGLSVAYLWFND